MERLMLISAHDALGEGMPAQCVLFALSGL